MTTRGMTLCNPGDIRISGNHWIGKVTPSRDADFETFDTMAHGIRAVSRLLLHYYLNDDLDTITKLVSRYAPSSENNTAAYIQGVCDHTGFEADATLDLTKRDDLVALVHAFIDQEQGAAAQSITAYIIDEAIGSI